MPLTPHTVRYVRVVQLTLVIDIAGHTGPLIGESKDL